MRVALLQLNPVVGDIPGNARKVLDAVREAARQGAELCVTSELALVGYPPRDLLLNRGLIDQCWTTAAEMATTLQDGPSLLLGLPEVNTTGVGLPLFNTALLLEGGRLGGRFRKSLLPTYDVFDEARYFEPFPENPLLEIRGRKVGVTICEDIWNDTPGTAVETCYAFNPVESAAKRGADLILNLSASPYALGKQAVRERILQSIAAKYGTPVIYVNQVGGNDDLIFDGRSSCFDGQGRRIACAAMDREEVLLVEIGSAALLPDAVPALCAEEEVWRALVMGTRDYVQKCGFSRVVLGLSGGVDSALTAAIAAEALSPAGVTGILMPSPYSSTGSVDDALALARNLGIESFTLPISEAMEAFDRTLAPLFVGRAPDTTEENIQARIRGTLLMAYSNKFHALLLTTGNKSELSVGYCTLYGDMSGGLAVIADVPKVMVYRICHWLNQSRQREIIPVSTLTKPPSAELRPNQTDQDSLPDYDILDGILERAVSRHQTQGEVVAAGYDAATVNRVFKLLKGAEFKRGQAAPGLKVTDRAFGTGWRMPIACRVEFGS